MKNKLTNNMEALVIVTGASRYSIPPGKTIPVDNETNWANLEYVRCGALKFEAGEVALIQPESESTEAQTEQVTDAEKAEVPPNGKSEVQAEAQTEQDDDQSVDDDQVKTPSREALVREAEDLGIKVDGRWSDSKLQEKIEEAL